MAIPPYTPIDGNYRALLSEWSKEPDLRPGVEKRVGSNPTECINNSIN